VKLRTALIVSLVLILFAGGVVVLREYATLKKIENVIRDVQNEKKAPIESKQSADKSPTVTLVTAVDVDAGAGGVITARVNFSAFKNLIERNPAILARWGTLRWKVLDDIPALCIKRLAAVNPFTQLGAQEGDCITKLDGETINQPMRNLGIWMSLGARGRLTVETLRDGEPIRYNLVRN